MTFQFICAMNTNGNCDLYVATVINYYWFNAVKHEVIQAPTATHGFFVKYISKCGMTNTGIRLRPEVGVTD